MRYHDILNEMPELIDATDFNLMDPVVNRELAEKLITSPHEVLREDDETVLIKTGTNGGNFALYVKDRKEIDYWVRYTTIDKNLIGRVVVQVIIWRNAESYYSRGLTEDIFFNELLGNWPAIMSDKIQTAAGQDFWRRQLGRAVHEGYRVALVDFQKHHVEWFDGNDFITWMRDRMSAWGKGQKFQGLRFLIARP